jgi:hypothetical protein
MKTNTIYGKAAVALIAIAMLSSCKDLFNPKDVQQSPNSPVQSQVSAGPLTTAALVGLGTLYEDTDTRIASMWGGQLAGQSRQHQAFQTYIVSSSSFTWPNYYNTAQNARLVQQKSTGFSRLQVGVGQVIEALIFYKLATLYGDVPYSEALDIVNHPTPKFDSQLSILNGLITQINTAVTNLKSGVGTIEGDFIYGGNHSRWEEAAMTLQARIYMLLKKYPEAAAAAAQGISASSHDMLMPHGTAQQVDQNLNYDFFVNSRPGDTSFDSPSFLPKFMATDYTTGTTAQPEAVGDVAMRNPKTDETGLYQHFFMLIGLNTDDNGTITGGLDPNVNDGAYQANATSPILTYYENQLIWAEALARQTTATTVSAAALTHLNNVRAGLDAGTIFGMDNIYAAAGSYIPYSALDFAPGGDVNPLTGPNAGKSIQSTFLTEVAAQKFIILIGQFEAFNELRRLPLATPVVSVGVPITTGKTQFPARFIYPQNELNTNPNTPNPAPDAFAKLPVFQ